MAEYESDDGDIFSVIKSNGVSDCLVHCALMQHSIALVDGGKEGRLEFNSDGLTAEIYRITKLVREICESKSQCFKIRLFGKKLNVSFSALGGRLHRLLAAGDYRLAERYSDHFMAPEVNIFLSCLNESEIDWAHIESWEGCSSQDEIRAWVAVRNRLVENIRRAAMGPSYKERKLNLERRIRKNLKSVLSGMVAAFERHSKILVLRLDVGFHKVSLNPNLHPKLSHEVIDDARKKLIEFIQKRFGKSLVWYLWKLEFGPEKGFHLHWLIFLNGSDHSQDINLTREIGEYWSNEVVPGEGLYFNCAVHKQRYRDCALGVLSAADPQIWKGLAYIAMYLTKLDYFVGAHISKNRRTLGKGTIKTIDGEKPGPKRRSALMLPPSIERIVFGR